MDQLNICIGLCVYNSEQGIHYVISNLLEIKKLFKNCKFIFSYHESTDNTYKLLTNFLNSYPENVEILINTKRTFSRTANIAIARNLILDHIREKYILYEYFAMMDCNEYACVGPIDTNIMKEVFLEKNIEKWDAVSFDREDGYYDTWALSFHPYIYSFFHFKKWNVVVEMMRNEFSNILSTQKRNNPDDFINVYSAFNGFSIYKMVKFIDCNYSSNIDLKLFKIDDLCNIVKITKIPIINNFSNDCEHRHFHLESISKHDSKICIYPKSLFTKIKNTPTNLRAAA